MFPKTLYKPFRMSIELVLKSFYVIVTTLTGFSWHLGCCIPHQVLAHLTSKQRRIHTLSLIIDGTCTNREDYSGLCKLKKLRSITWKGMRLDENHEVIRRFFQSNSQHLEYLEWNQSLSSTTIGRLSRLS